MDGSPNKDSTQHRVLRMTFSRKEQPEGQQSKTVCTVVGGNVEFSGKLRDANKDGTR